MIYNFVVCKLNNKLENIAWFPDLRKKLKKYTVCKELRYQRNKHMCNVHYEAMPMMTSQILRSMDFTNHNRYAENETSSSLQIKKFINYTSKAAL